MSIGIGMCSPNHWVVAINSQGMDGKAFSGRLTRAMIRRAGVAAYSGVDLAALHGGIRAKGCRDKITGSE